MPCSLRYPLSVPRAAAVLGELLSSYEQREPLPDGQLHAIRWVLALLPCKSNHAAHTDSMRTRQRNQHSLW